MKIVVFVLDEGITDIDKRLQRFKDEDYLVVDVSLGNESIAGSLGEKYIHISGLMNTNDSREKAYKWLDSCVKKSGLTDETRNPGLFYDRLPLWWFIDILIQEKTFLVFRLVHTLIKFLQNENYSYYSIIGNHKTHPWKKEIIHGVCHKLKLKEMNLAYEIKYENKMAEHIETSLFNHKFRYISFESFNGRIRKKIFFYRVIPMLMSTFKRIAHAFIISIISITFFMVSLLALPVFYFFIARNLILYKSSKDISTIISESIQSLYGLLKGPYQYLKHLRKVVKTGVQKFSGQSIKHKILIIQDMGDIRRRQSIKLKSAIFYNPYMEGLADILDPKVSLAFYGSSIFDDLKRKLRSKKYIQLSRIIDNNTVESVYREHETVIGNWERAKEKLSKSMKLYGINLWEIFSGDLDSIFKNNIKDKLLYYQVFSSFIKSVSPRKIVLYNFEGALRPLFLAAKKMNIKTITIQQALGPYGHALDTREKYMINKENKKINFPAPDNFCVWSQFSRENLKDYGYDNNSINITGYLRLDTFYREKNKSIKKDLLNFFKIYHDNPVVIIFTAMYSVIGTSLITIPNYLSILNILGKLIKKYNNLYILVKPWHGDNLNQLINLFYKAINDGDNRVIFLDPRTEEHNIDILFVGNMLVGTMSSIFAEGIALNLETVLLDFTESRYYFEDKYMDQLKELCHCVTNTQEFEETLENIIQGNHAGKSVDSSYLFGPVDGQSKKRVMTVITG